MLAVAIFGVFSAILVSCSCDDDQTESEVTFNVNYQYDKLEGDSNDIVKRINVYSITGTNNLAVERDLPINGLVNTGFRVLPVPARITQRMQYELTAEPIPDQMYKVCLGCKLVVESYCGKKPLDSFFSDKKGCYEVKGSEMKEFINKANRFSPITIVSIDADGNMQKQELALTEQ